MVTPREVEAPHSMPRWYAYTDVLHRVYWHTHVQQWAMEEILSSDFKGIVSMLTGKAWSKALRGLRMVAVALLEPFIPSGVNSVEDFEEILEKAQASRTDSGLNV